MRRLNRFVYCLAATLPVAVLMGCSSGGSSSVGAASGPPPDVSTITSDAVPTADAAGLYVAYDEGLFAKQGLKVKIDPIDGGEFGMGDLQDNSVQLVEGNYVSFVLAQIAGTFAAPNPQDPAKTLAKRPINLRIIANSSQMQPGNQALYVLPNSRFKTVAELAKDHATIGINSPSAVPCSDDSYPRSPGRKTSPAAWSRTSFCSSAH